VAPESLVQVSSLEELTLIPDSAKRGIDMLWQEPEGLECQLRTTRTTRSLLVCCCEHGTSIMRPILIAATKTCMKAIAFWPLVLSVCSRLQGCVV
jgi:hypothetical protein